MKVRVEAVLDGKTCSRCVMYHGLVKLVSDADSARKFLAHMALHCEADGGCRCKVVDLTDQAELFAERQPVHPVDTSLAMAEAIHPQMTVKRLAVLACVRQHGPMTADAAQRQMKKASPNMVAPIFTWGREHRFLEWTGEKERTQFGKHAGICEITVSGLAALARMDT